MSVDGLRTVEAIHTLEHEARQKWWKSCTMHVFDVVQDRHIMRLNKQKSRFHASF